jgi:hypothetical protein
MHQLVNSFAQAPGYRLLPSRVAPCNIMASSFWNAVGIFTLIFQEVMSEQKTGTEFDIHSSE